MEIPNFAMLKIILPFFGIEKKTAIKYKIRTVKLDFSLATKSPSAPGGIKYTCLHDQGNL